ncbi:MAG: DNA primase, partial [Duncaniella sp.]|nr:DNA primase [Duncaniella sp.]
MGKISSATVQRILDATDIVEVVSDFVSLKRRGANWWGLCPFHNDRSPSFSVSKSKGMCKCFSCGEGGSAINFLMKLESLSYVEALKYLARKYNIEVEERELTPEEQRRETARESMLAVNDFALRHFKKNLTDTVQGRDIGLSYFRHRGISDAMIEKFHLGYALEDRDILWRTALERGYSEDYLMALGLCTRTDDGRIYDRFRGRVIYPVHSLSGKVVAFGARTLRSDKKMAKYMNSPESDIYSKRRELYGLYQAKQAISKEGKCIIVEGYMDVISMHQAGVCNVVASSGTALTIEQVRLIKRFTNNVTLIYDADAAGIKASLRGIELLLQEGLDIKVLLLPPGEDPDSYAQNHSSTEVTEYISANETDFITFMSRVLLADSGDDPTKRAAAITRIVKTIALIPNEITRNVYVQECANILFISEDVLQRQVGNYYNQYAQQSREEAQRQQQGARYAGQSDNPVTQPDETAGGTPADQTVAPDVTVEAVDPHVAVLRRFEKSVLQLVARYGNYSFASTIDEAGNQTPVSVIDYVEDELRSDGLTFSNPDLARFFAACRTISRDGWNESLERERERLLQVRAQEFAAGIEEIRSKATDLGSISAMERDLTERVDKHYAEGLDDFSAGFLARLLCSSPDDTVRNLATELVPEKYVLSKVHTKYAHV